MGGGNSHQFGSFCYLFPTGRAHSSAFIFSRLQLIIGNIYCWHLFWWSFHDHPIVHSRPYGLLPVLHTVRYFCETFIQPVRVSFLHNYRTVLGLLNAILQRSIPYGTILHFHLQGEGVPRPLARSHALLPWSRVLTCATTISSFPT